MSISTVVEHGILIIRADGELDLASADELRRKADEALETGWVRHILLNLRGVTFIDSSGLGVILGRYKRVTAAGGRMAAAHLQPSVERVFEISGLLKLISVHASEREALDHL